MANCVISNSAPELISLFFSPWSIKVKWALAEAGVSYVCTERPADEDALRKRLGLDAEARITYPMMVLPDGSQYMDSSDIAKFAARSKPALFPEGEDVAGWLCKVDCVAQLARSQLAWVMEQDDLVLFVAENMPGDETVEVRKLKVKATLSRILGKYSPESDAQDASKVYAVLKEFEEQLGDRQFLFSQRLSYVDISMATALQMYMPPGGHPLLPTAPHLLFGKSPFAQGVLRDFPKLIAWADALIRDRFPQELRR